MNTKQPIYWSLGVLARIVLQIVTTKKVIILIELRATMGDDTNEQTMSPSVGDDEDELNEPMASLSVASEESAAPPEPSESVENNATGDKIDKKGPRIDGELKFLRHPPATQSVVPPSQGRAKWTIHAVNVHQGDAILLDLHHGDGDKPISLVVDTGKFCQPQEGLTPFHYQTCNYYPALPHKRYLVDGGDGSEKPLENLLACLRQQGCLGQSDGSPKQPLKLEAIIVTHPDKDHVGGVTKLLKGNKYEGELMITEAFETKLRDENNVFLSEFSEAISQTFASKSVIIHSNTHEICSPLRCHFPMSKSSSKANFKGIIYSAKEETDSDGVVPSEENATNEAEKDYANKSSILTTVNQNDDGFDVMLTGDSNAKMIQTVLSEKRKGQLCKPHVKVFQVPHHGSENNSNYEFYTSFTADVYLISGGGNDAYNHPSNKVLSAIVHACVDNEHTSKVVVTNSRGLKLPLLEKGKYLREKLIPGSYSWRDRVQVYHLDDLFNPDETPTHVTITSDQLLQDSDVISWSPEGYITKIKECKEKLKNMEVQIFKHTEAGVVSCSGESKTDCTKIVMAPVPEEPWIKIGDGKRHINQIYVLKDSITDDYRSACFLELDEETRGSKPEVYWMYRYHDNYFECKEYLCLEFSKGRQKLQEFLLQPQPDFTESDKLY